MVEAIRHAVHSSFRTIVQHAILSSLLLLAALLLLGFFLQTLSDQFQWPSYAAMCLFYAAMFYVGSRTGKSQENLNDEEEVEELILAGRSLPLGLALFTMTATWVGGGFINGTAEAVARDGLVWAQAPWGYALSLIIGGIFFAKKMRLHNFSTLLDPIADRFGKRMTALLYIPAMLGEVFWTGAVLTALGTTFGTILGIDFSLSIIISALIAITYTAIGGLRAVANTDVLQLGILIVGLWITIPFLLPQGMGLGDLYAKYSQGAGESASFFPPLMGWQDPHWGNSYFTWWDSALLLIFGGIPWHVYFQRVLSSKNAKVARWLSIGAGGLCIVAATPAVIIGMIGATTNWDALHLAAPTDMAVILPYVLQKLAPPVIAIIGLGALASAVMSSADSSILSASSLGAWNVYRPFFAENDHSKIPPVIKRSIWIIGIAATIIALKVQSVYQLWFLCSDFVYCILFPQLLLALYDRKTNAIGSLAGFIVALVLRLGGGEPVLGIPHFLPYPMINAHDVVEFPFRTTAMLASLLTIIVISRLT
ncbi:MAG: sodium:solute symporter family protein, partial [Leptospiraceae bacterium]|nr:sodium:solute symporter family protein [Leptospiraceae bacterium]